MRKASIRPLGASAPTYAMDPDAFPDLKREREALWFLIAIRRYVATHQHMVAECEAAVHDLVPPVGRDLIRQRSPGVTEHRPELAAETLLMELERCLALSLEAQIRVHLHREPI